MEITQYLGKRVKSLETGETYEVVGVDLGPTEMNILISYAYVTKGSQVNMDTVDYCRRLSHLYPWSKYVPDITYYDKKYFNWRSARHFNIISRPIKKIIL